MPAAAPPVSPASAGLAAVPVHRPAADPVLAACRSASPAYYRWMNLPDADTRLALAGSAAATSGLRTGASIRHQWPRIRAMLDRGEPAALGLVTVASANPLHARPQPSGACLRLPARPAQVTLQVYDPNTGPADDVFHPVRRAAQSRCAFTHSSTSAGRSAASS